VKKPSPDMYCTGVRDRRPLTVGQATPGTNYWLPPSLIQIPGVAFSRVSSNAVAPPEIAALSNYPSAKWHSGISRGCSERLTTHGLGHQPASQTAVLDEDRPTLAQSAREISLGELACKKPVPVFTCFVGSGMVHTSCQQQQKTYVSVGFLLNL